ncbi:putative uncharacterized protein DNAJC9-AS1 isoform X1 [Symphalangus syndactylus]|uniref:putative uncharacterized protein DNAJC9-AS1 isoform X1 n=1 Tax=Symphalangus syndactylus TaxID=9590 RepID=UPI0024418143|nr:putative uncharacterized protein DNAJC9-AS1 [Symphalangus syndactylus]
MPGGYTAPEESAAPSRAGYNPGLLLFPAQKAQGACVTSTEGAWPRRASALYGGRKTRCGEAGAGPDPRSNSAEVSSSQPALASKSQSKWGPTSNNPGGALTTTEFEMAGNRSQNIKHRVSRHIDRTSSINFLYLSHIPELSHLSLLIFPSMDNIVCWEGLSRRA